MTVDKLAEILSFSLVSDAKSVVSVFDNAQFVVNKQSNGVNFQYITFNSMVMWYSLIQQFFKNISDKIYEVHVFLNQ